MSVGQPEQLGDVDVARGPVKVRPNCALIAEADVAVRLALTNALTAAGMSVRAVADAQSMFDTLRSDSIDVVVVDLCLTQGGVGGLVRSAEQLAAQPPLIALVAQQEIESGLLAVRSGAFGFLTKPLRANGEITHLVATALERRQLLTRTALLEEAIGARDSFTGLISTSTRMRLVCRQAQAVARLAAPVLILGEAGTGKQRLARAIHHASTASDFASISCALASKLAGVERLVGKDEALDLAATLGLPERSFRGTLYLSEADTLTAVAQAVLLTWLRHVREREPSAPGPRLIAGASRDLSQLVAGGQFRVELLRELSGATINLPPLRERPEDIPLLAYHFLRRVAAHVGRDVRRITPSAVQALCQHAWPGNVGELKQAIERAVLAAPDDALTCSCLAGLELGTTPSNAATTSPLLELPYREAKQLALEEFDRVYFSSLLRRNSGNVSAAARQAGLDRSNFRRAAKRVSKPQK